MRSQETSFSFGCSVAALAKHGLSRIGNTMKEYWSKQHGDAPKSDSGALGSAQGQAAGVKRSSIIFDFDGTIADSLPVVLELFYKWAKVEPFPPEKIQHLRNMTLKQVLREVGVPLWRIPRLAVMARRRFGQRVKDVPIFAGIPNVLKQLHAQGHTLYLISSNGPQNIRSFLKSNRIDQYFNAVQGNIGIFGKATAIRSIVLRHKLNRSDCFSIGDETRDVDAAKKAHVTSIAVTWGYNGEQILKSHKPDHLIITPDQLLKLFT